MTGKTLAELNIGERAQFTKTLSESDICLYAGITGDFNPAHTNEEYARKTIFKTRIVHGMLTAGFISTVMANHLPGPGTIYISQRVNFLAPVRIGDTVTAVAEVAELYPDENRVRMKTYCLNQDGTKVLDGEAIVSPPRASNK